MAGTSIRKTFSSDGNTKKWTFSAWIKRTGLDSVQRLLSCDEAGNNNHDDFYQFQNDNTLVLGHYDSGYYANLSTNRKFQDVHGWYHFVITWDTAQATSSDRFKFYVNGVQETSFSTATYPSQNADSFINTTEPMEIGKRSDNDTQYLDALLTHVHFCDGYAYSASDFGETDSNGVWTIKTSPSVSYGTNGFFILKDGNSLTDQSPNSNDWTSVDGTLTNMKDNPDNVFATLNPLVRHQGTLDITNTRFGTTSSWRGIPATMGVSTGKYYWEFKQVVQTNWSQNGIMSSKANGGYDAIYNTYVGNNSGGLALNSGGGDFYHDGSSGAYSSGTWFSGGLSAGDIISVALDADASKIWFAKNGTWGNSSNPSTGSGGIDFSGDADFTSYKPYFPACSVDQCECAYNFGNGYFGTSAITTNSGNGYSDSDSKAKFNYEVPTNFKAITTRGLNL